MSEEIKTPGTFYSDRFPVGSRVRWRREVYRVHFRNRPIDHGTVVENKGDGMIGVRPDFDPTKVVRGPGAAFFAE